MIKSVYLFLVLSSIEVLRVASFNLTISPDHVRVTEAPQTVSFTCAADVALAGCQFRWWNWLKKAGPLLELSRGSESEVDPANLNASLTGYSYSGRGLGAGECGVSLQVTGFKRWMVACRVREENRGWKYAWAELITSGYGHMLGLHLTRSEEVALPGGEAWFMLKAEEPLAYCRFFLSGSSYWIHFSKGAYSADSTGRHLYLGAGLQSGECGLALTNLTEADNGPALIYIAGTSQDQAEYRFLTLIIASPPTATTLSLVYTETNVTATCDVQESRPVANMSWVLGDKHIRQDVNDDSLAGAQDEWRWPWMKESIMQTLTLQMQPQVDGKELKCVVSHATLAQPLEAKGIISWKELDISTSPNTNTSNTPMTNRSRTIYITAVSTLNTTPISIPNSTIYTTPVMDPNSTINTTPLSTLNTTHILSNPNTTINASQMTTSSSTANITAMNNISTIRGLNCLTRTFLELLHHEDRTRASGEPGSTSCPKDEVHELRVREAAAAARTAELLEGMAKDERAAKATAAELEIQVARSNAIAAELAVEAARYHARTEETWALNAEEELKFEKERRTKSRQHS